jgi:hypothetical protein
VGYDLLAFAALAGLCLALAHGAGGRIAPWLPARLLVAAVALRVVGSLARYEVLFRFYGGVGDAQLYFYEGLEISSQLLERPALLFSPLFWAAQASWWGTPFLKKVAGLVLIFIGPSMRAGFLAFSLIAFGGLVAIAQAFRNTQPGLQSVRYAAWLWLWPSLWFWPSSIGKEAVLVLAIGLTVLGYCRRGGGVGWPLFLAGLGLAFCVRPHVAMVLALATVAAHWLGSWGRFSLRRIAEAALAVGLCAAAFTGMRAQFGLENADFEGMREFVEFRAGQTLQGGSSIGGVPLGVAGIPMAFVNVWMRPFPWEAHNATAAFAALEITAFWFLVWQRRQSVGFAIRNWRRNRLLRFSLPFLLLYTLMIGIAFGNLGIIARQRAPIFPFMLMLLAAVPVGATVKRRAEAGAAGTAALPEPAPARSPAAPDRQGADGSRERRPPPVRIRWMPARPGEPPTGAT